MRKVQKNSKSSKVGKDKKVSPEIKEPALEVPTLSIPASFDEKEFLPPVVVECVILKTQADAGGGSKAVKVGLATQDGKLHVFSTDGTVFEYERTFELMGLVTQ